MSSRNGSGFFLAIEGCDGSGKTTLAARLEAALQKDVLFTMRPVKLVRMPGQTQAGGLIRDVLLTHREQALDPMTELLLMVADRCETVRKVISPALNRDGYVVCDRYDISSYVYQGYVSGLSVEQLHTATRLATDGLEPDLYIVLDVGADVQQQRLAARGVGLDRFELEDKRKVAEGYRAVTNLLFRGAHVIDTTALTPDEVFEAAAKICSSKLMKPLR
jgi:dTMP kinase